MMRPMRRAPAAGAALLLAALAVGCVAEGGYYGAAPGYGVGYYGPAGFDYGVWGPSYLVAPYRDGDRGYDRDRGRAVEHGREAHAFHAAPAGRAMPSIPSASRPASGGRPGGGRAGGGHEGGGRR